MPDIVGTCEIYAEIEGFQSLGATIEGTEGIEAVIEAGGSTGHDYPIYSGETVVTPRVGEEVVLGTEKHIVLNDITVLSVPDYETSNLYGTTFIIG